MALIPLADYQPATTSLRPLDAAGASASTGASRLRPLGEYAAMPVNRIPNVTPPGPNERSTLARAIGGLSTGAGLYGTTAPLLNLPALNPWVAQALNLASAGSGAASVGEGAARAGLAAVQNAGQIGARAAGITPAVSAAPSVTGGINPSSFTTGAGLGGAAMAGLGMALDQPALGGFGSMLSMMAPIATAPTGAALTAGGAAAGSAGLGPLTMMYGPMLDNIGRAIARAFTDVPHDVREQAETQRALGQGETMLAEVGTAATPEQLWAALNRGVGTYGVPLDARYRTVDDLLADPSQYAASIQAGINPDFIAGTNAQLTDAVRGTAALLTAARAGDPQAQAILAARSPQREGYLAKAIALMSGPTMGARGAAAGEGGYQTGGGGAPEDVWGTLATSGGMRAAPSNLSQSIGGYNAANIASLPPDLFQKHSIDDIVRAHRDLIPQDVGSESWQPQNLDPGAGDPARYPLVMRERLAAAPKRDRWGNPYAPGMEGVYASQISGGTP